jgi:two-component system LytT family sensor kinase
MSDLLNLIGMSTGIALYAMLLVMVVRAGPASTKSGQVDPLLLTTALLGLVWNVCALPAYELPKLGVFGVLPLLTAVGFCALGFLPAVTVHSVLRSESAERGRLTRRAIVIAAYGVGATAAVLQARALWIGDPLPSVPALQLLTYAFVVLVVPLAAVTRGQPSSRRALWVAALSIFAVSAMHLSQFERGDRSWPVELVGHHASLPLAFAILYQDFPFALADLFLKRALTLLALFTTAFVSVATFGVAASTGNGHLQGARDVGLLVALWVATALLYPKLRALSAWFVDTIVLKRPDYALLRSQIASTIQAQDNIADILDCACADLRPALSARIVSWRELPSASSGESDINTASPSRAIAAVVDVPVTEPPRFALVVEGLTGGRRLLSDDHTALETIATVLARRIDAIRITRERYDRELREQEIGKLATEAELRALRAQINPHFLFNALTTIGHLIQTAPPRAFETLMRLTSLLRAVLRSDGELTTLGRELALIEAYLDIEHARFEQRLRVRIDVPSELRGIQIPPLLLQPLVENAVKHGIAPERRGGEVSVEARLVDAGQDGAMLTVTVRDSGAGASREELRHGRETGVGLNNIERRLECQYGARAVLTITSAPGFGTTVKIEMPAHLTPSEAVATASR